MSPGEVLETCLANIDLRESAVRAWVVVDREAARRRAAELAALPHAERAKLPLFGVPIGVKDIIDVAGLPTRAGSPLTSSAPVAHDAPLIARLRAAGAIILGKTVTTEFAYLDPPVTRNPWNLDRTPGGSSSGSAAAVAAGMCLAAIGTQTGGSVIRPAAFCGVVGFKPSYGWCSAEGVFPLAAWLDHLGIMARTVADAAAVYHAILGDTSIESAPSSGTTHDSTSSSRPSHLRGEETESPLPAPRIGIVGGYFHEHASPAVRECFAQAIEKAGQGGATVFPIELPPSFNTAHENHLRLMAVGAGEVHGQRYANHREQMGPRIRELVARGLATSTADYAAALEHQQEFQAAMARLFATHNCILAMPSAPTTAPTPETTGDPRFNSPWSYAGLPAITIPCGFDDGLPIGLQVVGAGQGERELLAAAAWCERALGIPQSPLLGRDARARISI